MDGNRAGQSVEEAGIQAECWHLCVRLETQLKAVGRTCEIQGCSQMSSDYYLLALLTVMSC